jgi:hypothetical protein
LTGIKEIKNVWHLQKKAVEKLLKMEGKPIRIIQENIGREIGVKR